MSFAVAAESYDRFMGRYSRLLAPLFADFAGVVAPMTVLEVGCGPGALTTELVDRLGSSAVTAIDPSEPFVTAARERHPGVEVHRAAAEELPFDDDRFDLALAQLVVHHMADPAAGVAEMSRVTRPGGTVAACVWDHAGQVSPLAPFWRAVREFDPGAIDESDFAGAREGHLVEIFESAGLEDVLGDGLAFEVEHATFEEWWEPFPLGVGPAGQYIKGLEEGERARLADLCRRMLPGPPFSLTMRAWAAKGSVRS